jgi:hypothetical protein
MFGLFKKKTQVEKLEESYKKLLHDAFKLSTTNRKQSDLKSAEADGLLKQIEFLQKNY